MVLTLPVEEGIRPPACFTDQGTNFKKGPLQNNLLQHWSDEKIVQCFNFIFI